MPVLEGDLSREVRLREHHDVCIEDAVADDLLFECLLFSLAVKAPYIRKEDAKLERTLLLVGRDRLSTLLVGLLLEMALSFGGPLRIPHVFAGLENGLLSELRSL